MDGEDDLEICPEVGKIVLFDPSIRHGVRENRSGSERISLAFNLFPFPLPVVDL
jgi:ectoine hydroxylase-related dioxygenase (phytanoyl-CoA dioxygenase family)